MTSRGWPTKLHHHHDPHAAGGCVPFLILVLLALTVAGSTLAYVHIPWALFVLVGLFVWYRSGRFHHFGHHDRFHHHADRHLDGSSDHQIIG